MLGNHGEPIGKAGSTEEISQCAQGKWGTTRNTSGGTWSNISGGCASTGTNGAQGELRQRLGGMQGPSAEVATVFWQSARRSSSGMGASRELDSIARDAIDRRGVCRASCAALVWLKRLCAPGVAVHHRRGCAAAGRCSTSLATTSTPTATATATTAPTIATTIHIPKATTNIAIAIEDKTVLVPQFISRARGKDAIPSVPTTSKKQRVQCRNRRVNDRVRVLMRMRPSFNVVSLSV